MIRSHRLTVAGLQLEATSVGGIETCYQLPGFDTCLDIGRCPDRAVRHGTLLLTHAHIDHAAGLPYYISMRGMLGFPAPRVFCPASAHEPLVRILEAWRELQADTDRVKLTPIEAGATIPLKGPSFARAFPAPHRIECLGYTLYSQVRKLKPELLGTSSEEIARRARAGEEVHVVIERAELCFPGDTRIGVVEQEPTARTARVLLLECTFLGSDVSAKKAEQGGHIHLDQIADRAALFQNEAVVLTHFSRRYKREDIEREVAQKIPLALRERLHLLVHED
ncbi:MAG: MBL fold metallo-hydrolase [Deltaproteobacteria bacterium]|nr:MBL fold metallo-hydrolase [Deltaproteobacteria bacterium]